jgi:TolB-like protein
LLEIHSITIASFNTLSRQKDVEIFAVSMKNLNIQLKKQRSKKIINLKSMISSEYHDFLNVFSKEKVDILSSHKKHDHRIELKKDKIHEYASLVSS